MFSEEEDSPLLHSLISNPVHRDIKKCACCLSEHCLLETPMQPVAAKSTSFLSHSPRFQSLDEQKYIKLEPIDYSPGPEPFHLHAEDLMTPDVESKVKVERDLFENFGVSGTQMPKIELEEDTGNVIKEVKVMSCFKRIENPKPFVKKEDIWEDRPKYARYRDKQWVCDECDRSFTLKQNIAQHFYQYHHPRLASKNRELKEVVSRYCCTKCDKIFTDLDKARRHEQRMHTDKKVHACEQCDRVFQSPHLLVEHVSVVHEQLKPFKCDHCEQSFGRTGGLRRHVLMVHENKTFMCPYEDCDHPGYKCSKALAAHIRSRHTLERPYACIYCERRFVRKNDLKVHEMTHSAEPHFKCGSCGTGFRRESYLRKHRMHCALEKEEVKPTRKSLRLKPPPKTKN